MVHCKIFSTIFVYVILVQMVCTKALVAFKVSRYFFCLFLRVKDIILRRQNLLNVSIIMLEKISFIGDNTMNQIYELKKKYVLFYLSADII